MTPCSGGQVLLCSPGPFLFLLRRDARPLLSARRHPDGQRALGPAADHQDLHQRRRATGHRVQNSRQVQRSVGDVGARPAASASPRLILVSCRSVRPGAPHSAWTQVPPDGARPPRRHRVRHPAAVERPDVRLALSAVEGHELLQQVTGFDLGRVAASKVPVLTVCSHRKDYSGEYTVLLIPCTVQPTQPWIDPGDKPLSCTAHAPERYVPALHVPQQRVGVWILRSGRSAGFWCPSPSSRPTGPFPWSTPSTPSSSCATTRRCS